MMVSVHAIPFAAAENAQVLYAVADNYADSKYPKLGHYGKVAALYVGNSYDRAQDIWGSERIYIRFDLSSLAKNQVIVQARLVLWQFFAPKSSQTYEAYRVLEDWEETSQNWENQPRSSTTKTSSTVAPNRTEVMVTWDITKDVKAWHAGEVPNYGTMIKVAEETRVSEASSGFWAREYTVGVHQEWRPRLEVLVEGRQSLAYTATIGVTGFPKGLSADLFVDGRFYSPLSTDDAVEVVFDEGTIHTIAVSGVIRGEAGIRYVCDTNETRTTGATWKTFAYDAEFLVSITSEPGSILGAPESGWYRSGKSLPITRTSNDTISVREGERLVFDAWYLNGKRIDAAVANVTLDGPTNLVATYWTEYYLNVTSAFGSTSGSGWYEKDSVASFSVDMDAFPADGILGILGMRKSFKIWAGSQDFVGFPSEAHGSVVMRRPSEINAIWEDSFDPMIISIIAVLAFAAVLITVFYSRVKKSRENELATERLSVRY
jgi:hypothetical protein